jgi:hypothetical protein
MKSIGEIERESKLSKEAQEKIVREENIIKDIEARVAKALSEGKKSINLMISECKYNSYVKVFTDSFYHVRYIENVHSPEFNTDFVYFELNWKN